MPIGLVHPNIVHPNITRTLHVRHCKCRGMTVAVRIVIAPIYTRNMPDYTSTAHPSVLEPVFVTHKGIFSNTMQ